jgi:pimeloyl-ACP methyl ester carboxylesterase
MSGRILALGFALTFSLSALAANHGLWYQQRSLLLQSDRIEAQALRLRVDGTLRTQEVAFFDQKLDHAAPNSPTFKQRFFVDSQYAAGTRAPVFYVICGEWNCGGTGSYSFIEAFAKKFRAHLIALEHRYYGESLPTRKLSSVALAHLNLAAAIADLARFQRHLMATRGFTGKWIAVGGSYAGTLAAFYREKHPELVAGALASSAPIFMKNEFREYDAHVAKVVNGSTCGDAVRKAVTLIEGRLATWEGALALKKQFKATKLTNDEDFLYVVADMLAAAVQYGRDRAFCATLTGSADLVDGYARAGLAALSAIGATPFDISLAAAARVDVTPNDNMRQWLWQSCREFGWFQVANGSGRDTSRSSRIDLGYHEEICDRLYRLPMGADGALNGEWYEPLLRPETARIIFTNGSNDPWLTLSLVDGGSPANPGLDLLMLAGSAHCNDLTLATNLPSVMNAHAKIEGIMRSWLAE